MITFFKNWCEGIIVAVIISIIIEAILPEGNNKKYVKVVIGIYIIFTILSPFLEKINTDINFKNNFDFPSIQTSGEIYSKDIQEIYADGIKETLKTNLEEKFEIIVKSIEIKYDEKYDTIENIILKIEEKGISKIQKIDIGNNKDIKEENDNYLEIKKYISENYEVNYEKIIIN